MAESTSTLTGRDELFAVVTQLPDDVTAALHDVAQSTAQRVLAGARAQWAALRKGTEESGLAEAMTLTEDAANKQFIVESGPPPGRPPMVPIWITYGTVKMTARPYMQPACDAENAQYLRELEAAALAQVVKALS